MDSLSIGSVEIVPLLDCRMNLDPCTFFPDYGGALVQNHADLLDDRGLLNGSITCYLVRSAGKNVLVDTGIGPRRRHRMPRGHLDQTLARLGIAPGDIDVVAFSHLHVDHTGWNTLDADGGGYTLFFPRARYLVQQREWDFWTAPEMLADERRAYLNETVVPLGPTGRIDFVDGEVAIDENLTFVASPGHTPGHVSIGVYSGGERAIITGDCSHHMIHLEHPDWSPGGDWDGAMAARTRDRAFDAAAATGAIWIAPHWPYPGMGRIVRLEGKRVFQRV